VFDYLEFTTKIVLEYISGREIKERTYIKRTQQAFTATYIKDKGENFFMTKTGDRSIKSVENAFDIIEILAADGPLGVSELADITDVPKSTAHIYLQTLVDQGYAVKDGDAYDIGLRPLQTGSIARRRFPNFQTLRNEVDTLAMETGEAAHLGVEQNGQRVIIYKSEPEDAIYDNTPTGEFTHMHWTAIGKALLAHLSESRVKEIVEHRDLPRATKNTITDIDRLFNEIEQIRDRGFAVEAEERREGVFSIAIPIFEAETERPAAAVSVSGPSQRLTESGTDSTIRDEILEAVRNRANIIELRHKHY